MSRCLVIAPFGRDRSPERKRSEESYRLIVTPVLREFGYKDKDIVRTIDLDKGQPGEIARRVIRELHDIELVIADLSDANPNVMYELALRHATGRPYILLSRAPDSLPFYLKGLNVVRIANQERGRERTKAELRAHIESIKDGKVDFQTAASLIFQEDRPRSRVCRWQISYSSRLAKEWLDRQEDDIKAGISRWRKEEQPPQSSEVKKRLIEYLAYDAYSNVKQRGELYYIFLDRSRDFRGYATFDLPGGQTHMRVNGRDSGDSITVEFEQPARQVTLGPGLSGEIRAFEFTIHFRQVDRGEYEGDFAHPEFEDTSDPFLIGKSKLQMV